jgi:hypothetical protein
VSVIWPGEAFAPRLLAFSRLPDADARPRTLRERCGS